MGVESTVGMGTVFWIDLGQTSPPQFAHHEPEVSEATTPAAFPLPDGTLRRTVLYVEDNPANLELVEQLIERRPDLRLLSAADGSLGIEFARAHLPDVILMDIHLPGISGVEAMKVLRADPATAHIPIIALSANAVPRDIAAGLAAGMGTVAATYGYLGQQTDISRWNAHLHIDSPMDLLKFLNKG